MIGRSRLWVLLASGLALTAILLLAAGLSSVELLPGQPLPPGGHSGDGGLFPDLSLSDKVLEILFRIFGYILLVLTPLAVIFFLRSPTGRRRLPLPLGILIWAIALYVLARSRRDLVQPVQLEPLATIMPPDGQATAVEFAPSPTPALLWVSTGTVALLLAVVLVAGIWTLWRRRRQPGPLARLAAEARGALDALSAGAEVGDTIMRCYFEMARIVEQERGVSRAEAMTPREFEGLLKDQGLPGDDVEQLTRLFEVVRYGGWVAGEQEKRQAIASLTAIAESSRGAL
jgi:hypothetical protein